MANVRIKRLVSAFLGEVDIVVLVDATCAWFLFADRRTPPDNGFAGLPRKPNHVDRRSPRHEAGHCREVRPRRFRPVACHGRSRSSRHRVAADSMAAHARLRSLLHFFCATWSFPILFWGRDETRWSMPLFAAALAVSMCLICNGVMMWKLGIAWLRGPRLVVDLSADNVQLPTYMRTVSRSSGLSSFNRRSWACVIVWPSSWPSSRLFR